MAVLRSKVNDVNAWVRAETDYGAVSIDPSIGNLRFLQFRHQDREIAPLHTAPWVDAQELPTDLPPVERHLAGDFFCAPFGRSDVDLAPPHGWSANSSWTLSASRSGEIALQLEKRVLEATIDKMVRLSRDAPLLYQCHRIANGAGALTVAHHPMVRVACGARLSTSPKRCAVTPDETLEAGHNALAYPAQSRELTSFPASDGGSVDLTQLPIAEGCEDFVTLVEAEGRTLGWTAVLREAEDDIVFFLKDARVLPVTMLWHSNGGREYAPWNGVHHGVLGIEDGCAAGAGGHQAALLPNAISATGVATFLPLGDSHHVRHVIGAIARPQGWQRVADIRVVGAELVLEDQSGANISLPFDPHFFSETY